MIISPPLADSLPSLLTTLSSPSSIVHPFFGKPVSLALLQPSVVLPSHNNFQPSLFSLSDKVFGIKFISGTAIFSGVLFFSRSVVQMRIFLQATVFPSSFLPTSCTCKAIKPEGVTSSIILAHSIPFTQVRIELPIASIRPLFHSLLLKAFLAGGLAVSRYIQARRASS